MATPTSPALSITERAFRINGVPARLSMVNFYDAVISDSTEGHHGSATLLQRGVISATLAAIKAAGHNCVRIHTLLINCDKPGTAHPFPGVWEEEVLVQGDFVLAECARIGLLVWAPAGDRWDYYHGGFASYANARGGGGLAAFLANERGVQDDWFTSHFDILANRVSTITGRPWREEIAIFASANEVYDDAAKDFHLRFASHVKNLASGARITADGSAASGNHPRVWALEDPDTDIVCTHLYQDHRFDISWARAQARLAKAYNKVYAIDEYDWREGDQVNSPAPAGRTRAQFFDFLLAETQAAGWWCVSTSQTSGHNDGYQFDLANPANAEQSAMKVALAAFNGPYTSGARAPWTFLDYSDTFEGSGEVNPDRFTTWTAPGHTQDSTLTCEQGQVLFRTGDAGGYQDYATLASTAPPATDFRLAFDLVRETEDEAYFRVNLRAEEMARESDCGTRYVAEFATWGGFSIVAKTPTGDALVMSGAQIPGWETGVVAHLDFAFTGTTITVHAWTGSQQPAEAFFTAPDWSVMKRGYIGLTLNGGEASEPARVWRVSNWRLTFPSAPAPLLCWEEGFPVPLRVRGLWDGSQITPLRLRCITA